MIHLNKNFQKGDCLQSPFCLQKLTGYGFQQKLKTNKC
jgi:hypothetical protein